MVRSWRNLHDRTRQSTSVSGSLPPRKSARRRWMRVYQRRVLPMVGKASLAAFAASALLLVGGQAAFAAADGIPFEKLVEVSVPSQADVDKVVADYDAAEYKRVEADG